MTKQKQRELKLAVHHTLRWLKAKMQQAFSDGDYTLADDLQQEFFALKKYMIRNKYGR